jgi:hypothetical protein
MELLQAHAQGESSESGVVSGEAGQSLCWSTGALSDVVSKDSEGGSVGACFPASPERGGDRGEGECRAFHVLSSFFVGAVVTIEEERFGGGHMGREPAETEEEGAGQQFSDEAEEVCGAFIDAGGAAEGASERVQESCGIHKDGSRSRLFLEEGSEAQGESVDFAI